MTGRRYVIEEGAQIKGDQWTVTRPATGEVFSCPTIYAALAVIAADVTNKPGIVALAEHVAEMVADMERYLLDTEDELERLRAVVPADDAPSHTGEHRDGSAES